MPPAQESILNQQAEIQHSMAPPAANAFRAHASEPLAEADPDVASHVLREHERQRHSIELIASGAPWQAIASRTAFRQKSVVIVFDTRQDSSRREYQSIAATR